MQEKEKITHNSKLKLLILNGLNFTLRFSGHKTFRYSKRKSANYKNDKITQREKDNFSLLSYMYIYKL